MRNDMNLQPFYKLAPNRVWRTYLGGKTLDRIAGADDPQDTHFPEDWLLSVTPARNIGREALVNEGISQVSTPEGPILLTELIERFPEDLFGKAHLVRFGPKDPSFAFRYSDQWLIRTQEHLKIADDVYYCHNRSISRIFATVFRSLLKRLFVFAALPSDDRSLTETEGAE